MSFFYDLNKKLDSIRATPEVTHKQLNERDMSRAAKGYEKYGKQGMQALARAGREGKALDPVRAKYDKYDESVNESAAAGYDPEMQARIKTATPQQLAQMAQELAGGAGPQYNSELKMLQQAQSELSGQMGEGRHSQDAMDLNPDFAKTGQKPGVMDRIARGAKKVADFVAPGDEELLDRLQKSSGARQPGGPRQPVKEKMSPGKTKSFAALAPPTDKITFADKIAGAKKEVDEMLGDVAAEAMKKALGGGRSRDQGMEEASTGNAFDYKNRKEPETQKSASFVHKGTYGTEYDGDKDDAKAIRTKKQAAAAAGQAKRGRGRPKNNASADTGEVMKPDFSAFGGKVKIPPFTGKITKHKMVGEDDLDPKDQGEYDQEGDMAKDTIKTVVRHAQALEKILGDNDNLPEWVQSKLAKIESMMTAVDDYMQNQADDMDMDDEQEPIAEKAVSKKQQRFMGMVSAAKKGEKPASKEVAKVAKTMKKGDAEDFASTKHKGLPEKAAKKNKEEDVEESTTSGSVATSGATPKAAKGAGGFTFGKGIYDSMNRELEGMISESMSINMSMNNDDHGGPTRSLTVTATDDDATKLALLLKSAGLGGGDSSYGSEQQMHEVSMNQPDYPTNTETAQDNFEYSGGLNKPKSTGQTTVPVIASQEERQYTNEGQGPSDAERMDHYHDLKASGMDPDAAEEEAYGTDDWYNDMNEQDPIARMMEMAGVKKKAVEEEKTEEGNKFTGNLAKARADGKKEADLDGDGDMEKVRESIFTLTNQWKAYKG